MEQPDVSVIQLLSAVAMLAAISYEIFF